ncbi:exostosin-like 1 isoform X1 [Sorex araneus]|uniref:exostosin-like 1 isoform X1 n=1 Tax=Sorex araneus TaxID=42254 RepID=UPI002433B57B|nr:exostosin-like 1 isoform X1 [Sorex araneus]
MRWRRTKSLWLVLSVSWFIVLLGVFPLLRLAVPGGPRLGPPADWPRWLDTDLLQAFSSPGESLEDAPRRPPTPHRDSCNWATCFDTSKCRGGGLKVHVSPSAGPISETHRRILASIEGSRYFTGSPAEACLHLLLSSGACAGETDPVPTQWNGGRNRLVLRLHPDPCPPTLQLGQAMVAQASPTVDTFRPGFDVALPLLPEAHPLRGGAPGQLRQHSPHPRMALLALAEEGGRWRPAGISSSACPWKGHCQQDPGSEQTHPGAALPNATFCLIPGHRPAALHFLHALQAGCIPVLLSPGWELPFSEVIDWTKAAIVADERLSLQVPSALQEMPPTRVLSLRQQTQLLWDAYFSSIEKVIYTTLEIIHDRILGASAHPSLLWNSPPGALLALPIFSTSPLDFPFYHLQQGSQPAGRFSALVWMGALSQPPLKLIQAVADSKHCAQVSERFLPYSAINTDAILSLDAHSTLSTSEVDFAFGVWQSFPERLVGFLTWSHFWDEARGGWDYTTEKANEFSMVSTSAAFYHRSLGWNRCPTVSTRRRQGSAACPWCPLASVWNQCSTRTRCPCCVRSIVTWRKPSRNWRRPQPCFQGSLLWSEGGTLRSWDIWQANQDTQLANTLRPYWPTGWRLSPFSIPAANRFPGTTARSCSSYLEGSLLPCEADFYLPFRSLPLLGTL